MKPPAAAKDGEGGNPIDGLLQSCLDRLAAGDASTMNELLNDLFLVVQARLRKRARQVIRGFRLVRVTHDTNDLMQETSIKLMTSIKALKPESTRQFLGLVGKNMRWVLIDLHRQCSGPQSYEANRATNVFRGSDGELQHHVDQVADAGDDPDLTRFERLHEAAERLDEADQELFHMRWFVGMTHAQIAAQLGCCDKTAKREWSRVKRQLAASPRGEAGPS